MSDGGRLPDKHERFALLVLGGASAAEAYRVVFPRAKLKTAETNGPRLLRSAQVAAFVEQKRKELSTGLELKAERVLQEFMRVAFADIGKAFGPDGGLLPLHEMPEDVRRALAGVEVEELFEGRGSDREHVGRLRKVKFWNKNEALTALGKHLKLFTDVVEAKVEGGVILLPAATSVEEWEKVAHATGSPKA